MEMEVLSILVVTERDDCQGPMVAAFLRDYSTRLEVLSVGFNPAKVLHPLVVDSMKECLINLESYVPLALSNVNKDSFDLVLEWPETEAPNDWVEFRKLRDRVKNEAFIWYRENCMHRK